MKVCLLSFLVCTLALATSLSVHSEEFKEVSKEELYQQLFNIDSAKECKNHTKCRFLKRHIKRDNNTCRMDPQDVAVLDQKVTATIENQLKIKGTIRYVKIVRGKYKYFIYDQQGGGIVVAARILISNANEYSRSEIERFRSTLKTAAKTWTNGNPYNFKARFDFDITNSMDQAAVAVKLIRGATRGPYFSKWSNSWGAATVAHEFGHVLGLDDEYKNTLGGGSTKNCLKSSIMCNHYTGRPLKYHYYLIFRRAFCKKALE